VSRNRILGQTLDPLYVGGGVTRAPVLVDLIYVNAPTGTAANIVLSPCPPDGCKFVIKDVGGNAGTQPITVSTSPDLLILSPGHSGGPQASITIATNFGQNTFTFSAALKQWMAKA
jgi:hypothetical protein